MNPARHAFVAAMQRDFQVAKCLSLRQCMFEFRQLRLRILGEQGTPGLAGRPRQVVGQATAGLGQTTGNIGSPKQIVGNAREIPVTHHYPIECFDGAAEPQTDQGNGDHDDLIIQGLVALSEKRDQRDQTAIHDDGCQYRGAQTAVPGQSSQRQ